jgi:2-dehydropantoate 2-reductase
MRIAIMGAGALGGYIGARLAAAGADVVFIARGAHLAAMQAAGLRIESPYGDLHLAKVAATDNPVDVAPVDVILFAVKLWDTDTAAAQMRPMLGAETRVVTVQNGVDSVEAIARHVPRGQVAGAVTYIPASLAAPGVIHNPGGRKDITVDSDHGNATIAAFAAAAARAVGLEVALTDDIGTVIWSKFVRFAAFSAVTSLTRSTVGPVVANPETRALLDQLVAEGVAIARAMGQALPEDFIEATSKMYRGFPPAQRSSMATDLEHGRRLELEWVSGRMHALGLKHGVPTPAHTAAYRALILHAGGKGG